MNDKITNEAGVREEIVAPILRALDYGSSTQNDVRYEMMLVYPHDLLGRKKKTDPLLIGKPDYICRAGGRVSWTIEAKPPVPISNDDIQQAYTYAKHPEVRAVYFCICNGLEFRVYDTNSDPTVPPILVVTRCHETQQAAQALSPLLSAQALLSRHAAAVADTQPAIGLGLLSFAQIVGGKIVHRQNTANLAPLIGFTISVIGGAIQRVDDGTLMAYFEGRPPYLGIQKTIDDLGLNKVEAYSDARELSTDPALPTIFRAKAAASFPEGQQMLDLTTHTYKVLARTLNVEIDFEAAGSLNARRFAGDFRLACTYKDDSSLNVQLISRGEFEFQLQ
jgi:Type I restriction enzyme R protein N terminus (HSDR_N)